MSRNIEQIYNDNPLITLPDGALFYVGSPLFASTDDAAITKQDLFAQINSFVNSGAFLIKNYVSIDNSDSPYTPTDDDYYISVDTSIGTVVITLPDFPVARRSFIIKDKTGNAFLNNIILNASSNIDDSPNFAINTDYGSVQVVFSGVSYEVF